MAPSTVEVDLRLEPDSDALVRRLSELKEELDLNIELASPPDFVPELPGFEEIEPMLHRYPAIDPASFRAKVERALGDS